MSCALGTSFNSMIFKSESPGSGLYRKDGGLEGLLALTAVEKEGVRKTGNTEFPVIVKIHDDPVEASGLT